MPRIRFVVLVSMLGVLTVLLGGCWTLSIHPLYQEDDLIYKAELEGVWGDPEDPEDETWQFLKLDDTAYRLIIREEKQSLFINPEEDGVFEVHMLRLGDHTFLDFFPEEPESVSEFYKGHVIPAHSFVRMRLEGHVLTMTALDPEWLREHIDDGSVDIQHHRNEGSIVLTASTQELQEFVRIYLDEAFTDVTVIYRLQ